ncbi:flagellar hook capping FlgD N-terminal domain-containing protein [Caballeronia sp. dw_276]|uniref:flagellar hook assembly protein FlgD n=1 Tax=Caballeronia sp. dw_276 TaxID=2719795 RepID=UPI001BD65E6A
MTTNTTIGNNGTTVSQTLLDTMNGASSASSSSSASSATGGQSASDLQNTFLTLLVTQLKNQDPTNPTDSSQMTSQLAQISTVSGIGQLNTSLTSLAGQLSAGQSTQAALLIGSTVLAPGNSVTVASGKSTSFGVQTANALDDLTINVKNSSGQIVNTLDLGAQPAGVVPLSGWTPVDKNGATLPDGTYTISAAGTISGKAATATVLSASQVQSVVQQADGTAGLRLANGTTVGLTSVASIL